MKQDFNMMKKLFISCSVILLSYISLCAQEVNTAVRLDRKKIIVGDQVRLTLSVTSPLGYLVNFPIHKDSLNNGIEIIQVAPVDTVYSPDKKSRTINQTYTVTVFDSGFYYIKPFEIQYRKIKDQAFVSLMTDSVSLSVQSIPIDTTKAIKDIKEPLRAPLTLIEILQYLGILLGAVVLILALLYVIYKVRRKEPLIHFPEKPKPPAHVTALEHLELLRVKKLWQSGHLKEYHSELTDIVRTYIEKRFPVNAMEMVTDEIIEALFLFNLDREILDKLRQLLQLADMVKFAKGNPLPDENDVCMSNAVLFVKSTIPAEVNPGEENEKNYMDNLNKQQ